MTETVTTSQPIVQLNDVRFTFPGSSTPVLTIDEFEVKTGERIFLQGPSGSGKTTLLNLIAAVLTPQAGRVVVDDVDLNTLRGGQKDQFRVDRIGLVFQQFNLLPFLSVRENIQLPCRFSKQRRTRALQKSSNLDTEVDRLLEAMYLDPNDVQDRAATSLSVGQQQRVAVARALIGSPALIIADEPTSALDSDARAAFIDLLFAEVEAAACTLLFVSHDASLATNFDRHINLGEINTSAQQADMLDVMR